MFKKTMLLASAVGALVAFAVPAVAGAQQLNEKGVALNAGAKITATSTNTKIVTPGGTLECANVTMHAEVFVNEEETSFSGAPVNEITTVNCSLNRTAIGLGHIAVTVTPAKTAATFHLAEGGVGTSEVTITFDIGGPAGLQCALAGVPNITYITKDDAVHVEGPLVADPAKAGCPATGNISGDFTLETPTNPATPVEIG